MAEQQAMVMAMAEPMAEPEPEPMTNSTTISAEELATMATLEDLLPTLLQIFLTVRMIDYTKFPQRDELTLLREK